MPKTGKILKKERKIENLEKRVMEGKKEKEKLDNEKKLMVIMDIFRTSTINVKENHGLFLT